MRGPRQLDGWPCLLAVLLVAAVPRLYRLDALSFWLDEAASYFYARGSPFEIWGADTHPPLHYSLLALWKQLGDSEYLLRLSSVLASLGAVWGGFRCGAEIGGRLTAPMAGLLLALSPFSILHAQELRMYALLECEVAWSLLGLLRLLRRPEAVASTPLFGAAAAAVRRGWLLYAAGALLALYTHNLGVLWPLAATLAVFCLWLRRAERRRLLRRWILVNAAVLLLWLPYWPALMEQLAEVLGRFWIAQPTPGEALGWLGYVTLGLGPRFDPLELCLAAAALAAIVAGIAATWRSGIGAALTIVALTPWLASYGWGLVAQPVFAPRAFIWIGLPAALALARGLASLCERPRPTASRSLVLTGALLAALLVSVRVVLAHNAYGRSVKPDWRSFTAELAWRIAPGDSVAVAPGYERTSFDYYRLRQAAEGRPTPPEAAYGTSGDHVGQAIGLAELAPGERLWLLRSAWYVPDDLLPPLLAALPCIAVVERTGALFLDGALLMRKADCARP